MKAQQELVYHEILCFTKVRTESPLQIYASLHTIAPLEMLLFIGVTNKYWKWAAKEIVEFKP